MSFYNVYRVYYWEQPLHQALFVETNTADNSGTLYHATGSVADGFDYAEVHGRNPDKSQTFSGKKLLGKLKTTKQQQFIDICKRVPAPGAKEVANMIAGIQYKDCVWWLEQVLEALEKEGVLS